MKLKNLFFVMVVVFAAVMLGTVTVSAEEVDSGYCGTNVTWSLDSDGLLTISGEGEMTSSPWTSDYTDSIKTVVIEKGVTSVIHDAFYKCSILESVTIPEGTDSIGNYAFYNCRNVTNIAIPEGLTSIGNHVFYNCSSLSNITIPESVISIGSDAFYGCSNLKKVYAGSIESWCNIEFGNMSANPISNSSYLYFNNTLAKNITIPNTVTAIKDFAFGNCGSLESVTTTEGMTSIGIDAFHSCSSLENVTILEGVTSIGKRAFSYCDNLTSITIPESVVFIDINAFHTSYNLKTVYAANIESWCNIEFQNYKSNPTNAGADLYFNNILANNITIPDTITSIKDFAFSNCDSLESVTISSGASSVGEYAFDSCNSLKNITFPESVTSIGKYAFSSCNSLASVTIPEGVTSIYVWAFYYCNNLKTVTLPSTIENIDEGAFYECSNITDVYYYGTETDWENVYIGSSNDNLKNAEMHYLITVEPDGISLDKSQLTIDEGTSAILTVAISPSNSTYRAVNWTSDNEAVATVSASGKVRGVSPGTATITATSAYGGYTAYCTVTVKEVSLQEYMINSVTIKDSAGRELTAIPGTSFMATVSVTNIASGNNTMLVLAQYTASGTFKNLMYAQVEDLPIGSTIKLTIPVDNSAGDITKVKAFSWKDFSSMACVGNTVSFPAE